LSVLDLTFANGLATQNACLSDWAVNQDIAYGSDHYTIQWTLFNNIEPCDNICRQRFNIKDTDCKKWIEAFEEAYKANFQDIAIIMDKEADITADTLEATTTRLTQIFEQASCYKSTREERVSYIFKHLISNIKSYNRVKI